MTISARNHAHSPLNIILVEDDDGDAKAIRRAFEKARIANPVRRCVDGVEALDFLRGKHEAPPSNYVMLVDVNMPRMSGLELVREVRRDPDLRKAIIFMLTTSRDDRDLDAAYRENVAGYVLKQNAGRDFIDLITTLDHYWRVVELPQMSRSRATGQSGI